MAVKAKTALKKSIAAVTRTMLVAVALTVTAMIVARPWKPVRLLCRRQDIKAAHAERQEMLCASDRHHVSGKRRRKTSRSRRDHGFLQRFRAPTGTSAETCPAVSLLVQLAAQQDSCMPNRRLRPHITRPPCNLVFTSSSHTRFGPADVKAEGPIHKFQTPIKIQASKLLPSTSSSIVSQSGASCQDEVMVNSSQFACFSAAHAHSGHGGSS